MRVGAFSCCHTRRPYQVPRLDGTGFALGLHDVSCFLDEFTRKYLGDTPQDNPAGLDRRLVANVFQELLVNRPTIRDEKQELVRGEHRTTSSRILCPK